MEVPTIPSIGEIVRKNEQEYLHGTTQNSKYVNYSMHDTIERIYAYLNSTHISGEYDSLGREKPFFNISIAAANIWMRATDIDRKHIRVRATKQKDWVDSFLATVVLQDWMKRAGFGKYLNKWGRILSRYGSAITKIVENQKGLHIKAMQWSRMIVDPVDFASNVKIEILELTEAELYKRIQTHGYNADAVRNLCYAIAQRETLDKKRKDNKTGYIRLYEVHGVLSKAMLTQLEADVDVYVQQMHVMSYVETKSGRKKDYEDFTLYSGQEEYDPYFITHLIEEDDRTLAVGSVESIFTPQWMVNHTAKQTKDHLDIALMHLFQTPDPRFIGQNVLSDLVTGNIFNHDSDGPLTRVDNSSRDTAAAQANSAQWKSLANEIAGISDAMLGAQPKSGTAWRLQETLLDESYSLFELMTENKGLSLEDMLRERIIPWLKKTQLNSSKEISAILEAHDIDRIDARYIKNISTKEVKAIIKKKLLAGEVVTAEEQDLLTTKIASELKEKLLQFKDQRFFKPSNLSDKTWKDQLKDLEWELDIEITPEAKNTQEMLTTLNTALQMIMTPGFENNKRAQVTVGKILELTGAMSPIEYNSIPAADPPQPENEQLQDVAG